MQCPHCQSTRIVKNGRIHTGKPKWMCKDWRRQFVQDPQQRRSSVETKTLIDNLLFERFSLADIVRPSGVSAHWLQTSLKRKYAAGERSVPFGAKQGGASACASSTTGP